MERLTTEDHPRPLDYILTVDIFNKGIDLPEVNQIILLRPTQSAIVFVQQLGRGLRKAKGKEFVVVLDFVANYQNNYMIPLALSGDRSGSKDSIRHFVQEGTRLVPGGSTIHFDAITRKRIFSSIDQANFQNVRPLKEAYQQVRMQLGRIPSLQEFDRLASVDAVRIFENTSLKTWHTFLKKCEKDYTVQLSAQEEKVLEWLSRIFGALANASRNWPPSGC